MFRDNCEKRFNKTLNKQPAPFLTDVPILYPLKTPENYSGGIKWEH